MADVLPPHKSGATVSVGTVSSICSVAFPVNEKKQRLTINTIANKNFFMYITSKVYVIKDKLEQKKRPKPLLLNYHFFYFFL